MSEELTTAQLLQMCYFQAEKATAKSAFYQLKSTASYRAQAAYSCQQWADFYAAMADKLELLLAHDQLVRH